MTTTPWYSEQAKVEVGATIATVATNTSLDNSFSGTDFTADVKDFSITGGERDLDTTKTLGYNEIEELKRSTPITATFTLATRDHDWFEFWLGTRAIVTGSIYRMRGGEKASGGNYGQRAKKAVLITMTDGTNTVRILMNSAAFTNIEESLAADGTAEQKVTVKCLASNFYWEDDFT